MDSSDSVSGIHKRYNLTLFNPSSHYQSLAFSIMTAAATAAIAVLGYGLGGDVAFGVASVLAVLVLSQLLDSRLIPNKEYSKSLHMSLFGNLIWLATSASALLASHVLGHEVSTTHLAIGMYIFASFRIGIFTTVLGTSLRHAVLFCLIQPVAMLLALPGGADVLFDALALSVGAAFVAIASVWSRLTDAAGRPSVESTHEMIQMYLSSDGNGGERIESIIEDRSSPSDIETRQLMLQNDKVNMRLVLPDIHPGPYHPIGGSNIPYQIYKELDSSAMVLHSISDHSLNIPSQGQVRRYLDDLKKSATIDAGMACSEPVIVQVNKARATGLLFDKRPMLFLSMSPYGMEDLPSYVKSEIEQFAENRNFEDVMIVDCHNAMGSEISGQDAKDMLGAAKSCLDSLITKEKHRLEFGYANSSNMNVRADDLADGGLGVLCLQINSQKYYLGWADANNMENHTRESVVESFRKNGKNLLELFTSDTHFSQVRVRNKNGYYQFGFVSDAERISEWYLDIAKRAEATLSPGRFEMLQNTSRVKIMGPKIFEDFKVALDNSLRITKFFAAGGFALFLCTLFL